MEIWGRRLGGVVWSAEAVLGVKQRSLRVRQKGEPGHKDSLGGVIRGNAERLDDFSD